MTTNSNFISVNTKKQTFSGDIIESTEAEAVSYKIIPPHFFSKNFFAF